MQKVPQASSVTILDYLLCIVSESTNPYRFKIATSGDQVDRRTMSVLLT
jgi:hypothetical protein